MSDINVKKNTQRDITHSDTKNVAYCNKAAGSGRRSAIRIMGSLIGLVTVSYTHLTLPTICSV